uniref:Uncharacterized protein n=1 Tax=Peronospora matthiolae TaxID=2874970 RepID=A0AAV1UAK2_9STRA
MHLHIMSPVAGGEVFIVAIPDYAGNAYGKEAQMVARELSATEEEYLDARERGAPRSKKSFPGSNIAAKLARISSRMYSMENKH